MRATYHNAAFLAAGVPVFDIRDRFGATDIVISSAEKGAALAAALGDKAVLLLRAHGFVAVAPSLRVRGLSRDLHRSERASAAAGRRARRADGRARRGGRPESRRDQPRDRRPVVGALEEQGGPEMKQQLVDAIRMLERAGYIDHNGHCSARRDANSFYINSGASVRGALTVDDIVTVRPRRQSRRGNRAAAARVPHSLRGLSRAARRQRRDAHASAVVDVPDDDGCEVSSPSMRRACCWAISR